MHSGKLDKRLYPSNPGPRVRSYPLERRRVLLQRRQTIPRCPTLRLIHHFFARWRLFRIPLDFLRISEEDGDRDGVDEIPADDEPP